MKENWVIVILLGVVGCAVNNNQSAYNIAYSSFECMGECPVYNLEIDSLRNLTFEGIENVKKGIETYRITKKEYNELTSAVNEFVTDAQDRSINIHAVDSGGKELVVVKNGKEQAFSVENGKPRTKRLDSVVNSILSARGLID